MNHNYTPCRLCLHPVRAQTKAKSDVCCTRFAFYKLLQKKGCACTQFVHRQRQSLTFVAHDLLFLHYHRKGTYNTNKTASTLFVIEAAFYRIGNHILLSRETFVRIRFCQDAKWVKRHASLLLAFVFASLVSNTARCFAS